MSTPRGKVYLVGAGPGDPGLLTLKGADCLARADVVLYDSLANDRLLRLAPAHAERCLVGKRHGRVTVDQDAIERMLIEHARAGRTVVRLKGGDPFVFGRGGEEAEACRNAGVDFEVVPGVTSAIAAPAYAGIPLTHRAYASSVTFVTGQPGDAREDAACDWEALARGGGTLVFLMAALRGPEIAAELIAAGMPGETPTATVRWGTTPRQQTSRASLAEVARAAHGEVRPPVVLVVGAVAQLAERIGWYESLPLFGRRIAVTRARHQADELGRRLEACGAEAVEFPTIEIAPPADPAAAAAAVARASTYDWVVLTSANGAERFLRGVRDAGRDIRDLAGVRIAAIGPATAAVVERAGMHTAAQPAEYRAEALAEALGEVAGMRVLLARAERAREVLPEDLRARGATVDVVAFYRTVPPAEPPPLSLLDGVDMVTFTSASTVENFVRIAGESARAVLGRVAVAAIGPITAAALERTGVAADVIAAPYTVEALADAIVRYFANRESVP
jgi:uroporphyrinogen III methyltransferase/synthase